ncbi:MAG: pentapeptide repeat-containing protein, partial [Candidatus Dadabacteria bacterium]
MTTSINLIIWIIAGLIILVLLIFVPKSQIKKTHFSRPTDRFHAENEARKTLAQIIGGTAIIIGLFFSWQTIESQRKTLELQRDDLTITREQQITERFTRAIEQLGSEKLEVRLGGIYALERIAKDSPNDHWTIMEVLTTYARDKSKNEMKETVELVENAANVESSPVKTDIQAIMTVLGRRNSENDRKDAVLNLYGVNLKGAKLDEYNFVGANFQDANLIEASLANTNLAKAKFGGANLNEAYLVDANLESAQLNDTDLEGAYLQRANLKDANLENANFKESKLDNAILEQVFIL